MNYFDACECDSYEDINNAIDTCVESHNTTNSNNCVDQEKYSCNSFFTLFSSNLYQKNTTSKTTLHKKEPDYSKLQPYFSWFSIEIIKNTFEHTTQYGRTAASVILNSD